MPALSRIAIVFLLFLTTPSDASLIGRGGGTTQSSGTLPDFTITSAASGTNTFPFTVGVPFQQGALTGAFHLNTPESACTVQTTWPDGSNKFGICGFRASFTQNTPLSVQALAGSGTGGAALTCASAQSTASASITVSTASPATIALSSATLIRTEVLNEEMARCDYKVTFSTGVLGYFYVTLYQGSVYYVRLAVDNGWVDQDLGNLTFTLTGTIAGSNVYGPASITIYHYTRWTADGWSTNPQISDVAEDRNYCEAAKLCLNYFNDVPDSSVLTGLYQTYTYGTVGDGDANEPSTGAQAQIGLQPLWEALYITSNGDARPYKATLANAQQEFGFPIVFRGHADSDLFVRPSQYATWGCTGPGTGGSNDGCGFTTPVATPLTWDTCHSSSAGYMAYMVTGDYFYAELLEAKAATAYLADGSGLGSGTSRSVFHTAVRCPAWEMRTMAMLSALVPTSDSFVADAQARLAANAGIAATIVGQPGQNAVNILYEYDLFQGGPPHCHGGTGFEATCTWFMEAFMAQVFEFVSDLGVFGSTDQANWVTARNYASGVSINLWGALAGTDYCYSWSTAPPALGGGSTDIVYNTTHDLSSVTDANFPANWNAIFNNTHPGQTCGSTLLGSSGGAPATGATSYYANNLPAVSMAIDHGETNAQAGLNRITGASNYSSFRNATGAGGGSFADWPQFGIQPRGQHI